MQEDEKEEKEKSILHLPIFLLTMFFLPDVPEFLILSYFFLIREFPLDTILG